MEDAFIPYKESHFTTKTKIKVLTSHACLIGLWENDKWQGKSQLVRESLLQFHITQHKSHGLW